MSIRLSRAPIRLAAGAFILNSGLTKWSGDAATAEGMQGFAAGTYPAVAKVPAPTFLKGLAAAEIALGGALLAPFVPPTLAGAGLVGFSGGLLGLYAKTPGMREGIRPTEQGLAVAKDSWLLGIGATLVLDGLADRRRKRAKS